MSGWNAADYAANSSAQLHWGTELIASMGLRGDEHVLDLGCGDGKLTAQLLCAVPRGRVVGVDASPSMVALAQSRFPNLTFAVADAARLPFESEFEAVFSNAVLHWVKDHPAMLAGVRRALRPGGQVLFQMGGRGNAAIVEQVVTAVAAGPRWRAAFAGFVTPYAFHGPDEYASWLPQYGFAPREVVLLPKDMVHAGRDGLAGWLRTTWFPWSDCLPAAQREDFWGEVLDLYLANVPLDADGNSHVAMVRLQVRAVAVG